ncbi:hypothetical protein GRF29_161g1155351 [Pseudopithomyces chartarum]|uniref:Uncharacterized protein n=1 Tax=Pseudopithomyces chartarum TaxID=1892770 RepID=A0AAN6LQ52_9PLEO|nr:hypothetical protein GRF29_161g1155351 [Pseudopithomyces chartarum]
MSGLEIVGVTFGLLPLIISAVENYPEVTDSFNFARKYRIELKTIKQTLDAEWAIFSSMLEYVLDGLISPDVIKNSLIRSSTEMWKEMSENYQFKERLGSSYTPFMDTVRDMYTSIQRFIDLLDLDDQGKVRWTEDTGFKLFAKRLLFSSQKRLLKD